jgi:hypothetical protein
MLANMVVIEDGDLLGKGRTRSCYRHPQYPERCIKIFHKKIREEKNHRKELREIRRLLKRGLRSLAIPNFYGTVETNRGTGFVFDAIKGTTGKAPTLREWVKAHPEDLSRIKGELYRVLLESTAVFSTPHSDNFMMLEDNGELKFAIVDGLGEKAFLKTRSLIPYLARRRFKEQWKDFSKEIDRLGHAQEETVEPEADNGVVAQ